MKENHKRCVITASNQQDFVRRSVDRVIERRLANPTDDAMIVILSIDQSMGQALADVLMPMPDKHWNDIRAQGRRPYARGVVPRKFIQGFLDEAGLPVAKQLREITGIALMVMDYGAVAISEIEQN